ncbi:MAG: HisA/HisF-related TIM barrel protein, partial [Bacteroidota bacterium]
ASLKFGSSTIVVAIEAIKESDGSYLAYTDNAREYTGVNAIEWAKRVEELGAGEIVLTSVDQEGTGGGFDLELTQAISTAVSIPVIAHGGAGSKEDIAKVIKEGKADAVTFASVLHYDYIEKREATFETTSEGNTEFLKSGKRFSNIKTASLGEVKAYLQSEGISCRQVSPAKSTSI